MGLLMIVGKKPAEPPTDNKVSFMSRKAGIQLEYNAENTEVKALSAQDKSDNFVLNLQDKDGQAEEFLITLRYEEKLSKVTELTKQPLLEHLESSAELNLAKKEKYNLTEKNRFTIDGHECSTLTFTYNILNNTSIEQQLIIIPITNDKAVYVALQSKQAQFADLKTHTFQPLIDSIHFIGN